MLKKTGVAKLSVLEECWSKNGLLKKCSSTQLCLMLQAFCLVHTIEYSLQPSSCDPMKHEPGLLQDETSLKTKDDCTPNQCFLIPNLLPVKEEPEQDANHLPWISFYFDFHKFLPVEIYHRLVCLMLAAFQHTPALRRQKPILSQWFCRFDGIHNCNWKISLEASKHRLKVSVL